MIKEESQCVSMVEILAFNIDNEKLSDTDFRLFVKNSLKVTALKDLIERIKKLQVERGKRQEEVKK